MQILNPFNDHPKMIIRAVTTQLSNDLVKVFSLNGIVTGIAGLSSASSLYYECYQSSLVQTI